MPKGVPWSISSTGLLYHVHFWLEKQLSKKRHFKDISVISMTCRGWFRAQNTCILSLWSQFRTYFWPSRPRFNGDISRQRPYASVGVSRYVFGAILDDFGLNNLLHWKATISFKHVLLVLHIYWVGRRFLSSRQEGGCNPYERGGGVALLSQKPSLCIIDTGNQLKRSKHSGEYCTIHEGWALPIPLSSQKSLAFWWRKSSKCWFTFQKASL